MQSRPLADRIKKHRLHGFLTRKAISTVPLLKTLRHETMLLRDELNSPSYHVQFDPGGGEEGVYKLYRYVRCQRVWFLSRSGLK